MTDDILEMIHLKESLPKHFHRHRDPNLWTEFKVIRNRLTSVIRQAKKDFLN